MENPFVEMLRQALGEAAPAIPYFIGILAFIGALYLFEAKFGSKKRRRWRGKRSGWQGKAGSWAPRHDAVPKVPDAADQLRTVMRADFTAQPLLNKSEARLFKAIDKMVLEARPDWQVMAQVSLGEILRCEDKAAYGCINSKRVDLLIVDEQCRPCTRSSIRAARTSRAPKPPPRAMRSRRKRSGVQGLGMWRWWPVTRPTR